MIETEEYKVKLKRFEYLMDLEAFNSIIKPNKELGDLIQWIQDYEEEHYSGLICNNDDDTDLPN